MAVSTFTVPYDRLQTRDIHNWFLRVFRINVESQIHKLSIPREVIQSFGMVV